MGMVVKNNLSAKNTLNTLNKNSKALSKSLKKVASGMKINSAADDASGLSISEQMQAQIRSIDQANTNAQNAGSLLKTAEGAASSTVEILKTLKEKAINAANDTNTDSDRAIIQKELDQSIDQISDNANVTFNGRYIFTGDQDVSKTVDSTIVKALSSDWIQTSLEMAQDAFGLNFTDGRASVNEMDVVFQDEPSNNALAYVSFPSVGGVTNKLTLTINMHYYNDMDETDPNGSSKTAGSAYLDRTIAHEMTHAVMAANIKDFDTLANNALYFVEGCAEVVHGIDDERKSALANIKTSEDWTTGTDAMYATGYAFVRFLAKQSGSGITAIKSMMNQLANNGACDIDNIINSMTHGVCASLADAKDYFSNCLSASSSSDEFLKKYCGIDLANLDTGSILGYDANTGDVRTAESTVLEGLNTDYWYYPDSQETLIEGLNVKWPAFEKGSGLIFHIGSKANQNIKAGFGDISAEGLGLKSDGGETLSVGTRIKASQAITIIDKAITKALDQQTNIGALQSRLEYTEANLTTTSENITAADSVIRDADMAKEMTEYTKNNVLMQSAQAMLSQANQTSSDVLSLLQ